MLLTQSTIQNLINCNSKNPKMLTIVRICDGLEISITDFLMIIYLVILIEKIKVKPTRICTFKI